MHENTEIKLPDIYYDNRSGCYWVTNDREDWIRFNESSVKRLLKSHGISSECGRMERLSPLDDKILKIQTTNDICYAAPLAGHRKGIYSFNGERVLVIDSPNIIEPKEGEYPLLDAIFDGLFNHPLIDQRPYLYGWLKICYECVSTGTNRPGQALVVAGPANSGKSLIQNLITEILGGRSAKPYRYMSGKTEFNSELFQAEHLMIEDDIASTDLRTRRNFGTNIKQVTVNVVQSCHPKGHPAISLKPFWRTTITLNDEPENLLILPPFDESVSDKIILLKAAKKPLPLTINTLEERKAFRINLSSELPAFLHFLTKWEIPSELRCERFGIKHYHHPELVKELEILSPENYLLELIDIVIFKTKFPKELYWNGTARELEEILKSSSVKIEVERILTFQNAMGSYLGRLQMKFPSRVKASRTSETRSWVLTAPVK